MAYILTDGGSAVLSYPYNIGLLRRDNPNVSFPASPTNAQLAEWNVYAVTPTAQPTVHLINENLTELTPTGSNASWTQVWRVDPATPREIEDRTVQYQEIAAQTAAQLVKDSDGYVAEGYELGVELSQEFVAYRDALRLPALLAGYPAYIVWPVMPSNLYSAPINLSSSFNNSVINGGTPGAPVDDDFIATFEAAL